MHRLDDVAADAELAQRAVEAGLQGPAGWADRLGETEAFELRGAAEQQPAQIRILGVRTGPEIDDAAAVVGDVAQRPVEARPALGLHLALECALDLLFGPRPQLERDPFGSPIAEAAADVVPADDQVFPIVGTPADQKVDMRIVGVPVIDRDPVEPGAEVLLHVGDELAGEGLEVADLGGVLRRDDEPEMMAVVLAALGEGALVRFIARGIEHPRRLAVFGHTFAFQIGDVLGQWRRAKACALVAHDPRLGHHAAGIRAQPD